MLVLRLVVTWLSSNPNGIAYFSPGLPRRGYPGNAEFTESTPTLKGLHPSDPPGATPLGLELVLATIATQGSSRARNPGLDAAIPSG